MPATAHVETAPLQHRQGLRERLLFTGPVLALGAVLLTLWGFVAWFCLSYPKSLLIDQKRELSTVAKAAAVQTEDVLRDAESSMRTIDLWLLTRGQRDPLNDVSLAQLAETLRDTSQGLVDVMLVTPKGKVFRIPTSSGQPHADVSGQEFFTLLSQPSAEGMALGLPLQLRPGGPWQLPLAMRLSAPTGELLMMLSLVDTQKLGVLHGNFLRGADDAVTLLRGD